MILKKHNYRFQIDNILNIYVVFIGLIFYGCENTLIDNADNNDYGIVINEINYNSSNTINPKDWVELHNFTNQEISISGWQLKDENEDNVFTVQEDIIIAPMEYLVLCKDIASFSESFPYVYNVVGDFNFGLNGNGEMIRILDSNGVLVDFVEYDDAYPWPTASDGSGYTLELINPSSDNNLGESWSASNIIGGTPGETNSVTDAQQ